MADELRQVRGSDSQRGRGKRTQWPTFAVVQFVLVALILAACGAGSGSSDGDSDEQAVTRFIRHNVELINERDWRGLYQGVSPRTRELCTYERFRDGMQAASLLMLGPDGQLGVVNIKVTVDGEVASASYDFQAANQNASKRGDVFAKVKGKWYDVDEDGIICPNSGETASRQPARAVSPTARAAAASATPQASGPRQTSTPTAGSRTPSVPPQRSLRAVASIPLRGSQTVRLAVNPVANRVYGADPENDVLWVIDGEKNTVISTIPFDSDPLDVAVNSVTNRVYVLTYSDVRVIDGETGRIVARIQVCKWPVSIQSGIAVDERSDRVYVAHSGCGALIIVDGSRNVVIGEIALHGGTIHGLAVNPVSSRVYVTQNRPGYPSTDLVYVIDGATGAIVTTMEWEPFVDRRKGYVRGVAVNTNTNKAYVARGGDFNQNGIIVFDEATGSTVERDVGRADAIVADRARNRVYSVSRSGTLEILDGATNSLIGYGNTGVRITEASLNFVTGRIYLTDGRTISVFEDDLPD